MVTSLCVSYVVLVWLGRSFGWKQKSEETKMDVPFISQMWLEVHVAATDLQADQHFFSICFQCSELFLAKNAILWVSELLWRLLLPVNRGLVHWAASKSCVVSYQFQEEWVKCLPTWNSFPVILGRSREAHNSFSSLLGSSHQVSCTMHWTVLS